MIPLLRTPPWPGQPPRLVNELKLDRDKLLEWKKWTAPAKAYLRAKEPQFDLLPVIESYMNAASGFFNWFIEAINERNAEIKGEYQSAAQELMDWYQKETGITDEFMEAVDRPRRAKFRQTGVSGAANADSRSRGPSASGGSSPGGRSTAISLPYGLSSLRITFDRRPCVSTCSVVRPQSNRSAKLQSPHVSLVRIEDADSNHRHR